MARCISYTVLAVCDSESPVEACGPGQVTIIHAAVHAAQHRVPRESHLLTSDHHAYTQSSETSSRHQLDSSSAALHVGVCSSSASR